MKLQIGLQTHSPSFMCVVAKFTGQYWQTCIVCNIYVFFFWLNVQYLCKTTYDVNFELGVQSMFVASKGKQISHTFFFSTADRKFQSKLNFLSWPSISFFTCFPTKIFDSLVLIKQIISYSHFNFASIPASFFLHANVNKLVCNVSERDFKRMIFLLL